MKKVIQVPIDERLLIDLDSMCKKRGQSRSELIRQAYQQYLRQVGDEEMDEIYQEGYRQQPEDPALDEAQAALTGQILSEESW